MWMEGAEGKVKSGGARCAPRTKVPRVMWHKLQLLNLALHCFHTRERTVMLIRLDSLRGKKNNQPQPSPFTQRLLHRLTPRGRRRCHRAGAAALATGPAPTGKILWLCPIRCREVKEKAFSQLELSGKEGGKGSARR